MHLPPSQRNKLYVQYIKYTLIGYSTLQKGFICYDLSSNKFRVSRNVNLFENQYFPNHIELSFVSPLLYTSEDLSLSSKRFKPGFMYE